MQLIKQNLGIEVDSKFLKVVFQQLFSDEQSKIKGSRKFNNTAKGFIELENWLEKKRESTHKVHLTMEATGVYYENVAHYFSPKADYLVHVLLPNTVRAFFNSYNMKSKTDDIDARGLALMGIERKLEDWQPPSQQMRTIKKMNRARLRLIRFKTMVSNQLHAEKASHRPEKEVVRAFQLQLNCLERGIKKLEKQLANQVEQDDKLCKQVDNICEAPGVGLITAVGVLSELNAFQSFKNRNQVVSFCGYDIVKRESGTSVRGKEKISKKGNSRVRQMLYMAAMSAARHDEHHKAYYQRIVERTGIKMKANVAIQRKLLLLIYALSKPGNTYCAQHPQKMKEKLQSKQQPHHQTKEEASSVKVGQDEKMVDRIAPAYSG